MRVRLAVVVFLSLLETAAAQTRSEVPLREVTLSDGVRRYGVMIKVGETEIEAGLDSGSTGLRILPGTLKPADASSSGNSDHYAYGAGTEFRGDIGKGRLAIAGLADTSTLQLIQTKNCTSDKAGCPASKIPMEQFGIQGDGIAGAGFKAILGINMAEAEIASPLTAIGAKRWIIELPRPGSGVAGRLVLNPGEDETKDYVMLPIAEAYRRQHGGLHDAVTGCIVNQTTKVNVCGPVLLDTGAPGINVVNSGLGNAPWANNTPAALGFYDGRTPRAMENFSVGLREHASRLSFTRQDGLNGTVIYAGLSPYFAFDVLYDPAHNAIGLKPRPADPSSPTGAVTAAP